MGLDGMRTSLLNNNNINNDHLYSIIQRMVIQVVSVEMEVYTIVPAVEETPCHYLSLLLSLPELWNRIIMMILPTTPLPISIPMPRIQLPIIIVGILLREIIRFKLVVLVIIISISIIHLQQLQLMGNINSSRVVVD